MDRSEEGLTFDTSLASGLKDVLCLHLREKEAVSQLQLIHQLEAEVTKQQQMTATKDEVQPSSSECVYVALFDWLSTKQH